MILARSRRVLDGKVGFTFAWMGKVRDSSLALRALNSMDTQPRARVSQALFTLLTLHEKLGFRFS